MYHNVANQNSCFRYTLSAKGSFPIAFDQIQELTYIHKGYSVFIQTDKSVYRYYDFYIFYAISIADNYDRD